MTLQSSKKNQAIEKKGKQHREKSAKKPPVKKRKEKSQTENKVERIEFVQPFIPVKTIRHGIIETTDDRFIKIVEVEPINFMLRSSEEQYNIISSFANWLKISPMKLQFKSITRKADSDNHIRMVEKELGKEYINLIKDVGNREALTRRFFLIFEYEPILGRRQTTTDYADVYSMIQTAIQTAKTFLTQCGNTLVQPKDEDEFTTEVLYMFFNRKSCITEPFRDRVNRVVMDTMISKGKTIGLDPVPNIRMTNFIAPRGIDFTHHNYIIMDGTYYTVLCIRRNGYPSMVRGGWMSSLINAGEGIDVDVFLNRENRGRTIDKVSQRIRLNKTKLRSVQDTSTDFEELTNSIQSGYYIKDGIANRNEDLFYMSVFITVSASSYEELYWRKHQMTDMLKSMDMYINECSFQQEAALRTVMPFCDIDKSLAKKTQRNILTSGAASTFIFTSFELSDDHGVLLGINRHNNSLCVLDLFNSKKYKNANMVIVGTTGAGKTFTFQTLALRMRMRGTQCFILAPLKGHEFRRACTSIGGSFIRISPGSNDCINIMEIRQTTTPEMDLIDDIDYNANDSLLARKIQQLSIFFSLLIPDMSNEEEQMLDEALVKTYNDKGIFHDNDSLYTDATKTAFRKMPILGDLHENLQKNKLTKRLAIILSRFVTGSARSFNGQTNVDLENKYVVLDLSELKGKLLPVGMFIALDFVWDKTKMDRTKKKAILCDEIWQLIGASSNKLAAEFCLEVAKIIRGYGGGFISSTQDLSDFFALDEGRFGRAILNNSKTKLVLNLEPDEAEYVKETLKLTPTEVRNIIQFERGQGLIISNSNKVPINIRASRKEQSLITTDRAELEKLLHEKKEDL